MLIDFVMNSQNSKYMQNSNKQSSDNHSLKLTVGQQNAKITHSD